MDLFTRLGAIGALMVSTACGGKLAAEADSPRVVDDPPIDAGVTPPPTDDPPVTADVPVPATTIVDLTNADAARVCVDRASAARARSLGKVSIEKGWTPLARAVGVEAATWEGGWSSGGPVIAKLHLDLTFPLPVSIDPTMRVRTDEEFVYELEWPGPGEPADLFLTGTSYEVDLHDKGWLRTCSAKGTSYSHNDEWPASKVTVTIEERTDHHVSGSLERPGPYGVERLVFDAPIVPSTGDTPTYASPEICCLGDY